MDAAAGKYVSLAESSGNTMQANIYTRQRWHWECRRDGQATRGNARARCVSIASERGRTLWARRALYLRDLFNQRPNTSIHVADTPAYVHTLPAPWTRTITRQYRVAVILCLRIRCNSVEPIVPTTRVSQNSPGTISYVQTEHSHEYSDAQNYWNRCLIKPSGPTVASDLASDDRTRQRFYFHSLFHARRSFVVEGSAEKSTTRDSRFRSVRSLAD